MKKIAIFGAGGFGREVAQLICDINIVEKKYQIEGFFDDGTPVGTQVNSWEVLGGINELNNTN